MGRRNFLGLVDGSRGQQLLISVVVIVCAALLTALVNFQHNGLPSFQAVGLIFVQREKGGFAGVPSTFLWVTSVGIAD